MNKVILSSLASVFVVGTGIACYSALRKLTKTELRNKILQKITQCYNQSTQLEFVEPFDVQQTYSKNEQGIEFHIKLVRTLAKKPVDQPRNIDPLIQPFQPGQFVMKLEKYNLLLNKYPVNPYHTLLVPDAFIHQTAPFTKDYLSLAYDVLRSVDGFAFFNSHPEAGASLSHKHVQIVPQSAFQSANILNHISQWSFENSVRGSDVFVKLRYLRKTKHFIVFFDHQINEISKDDKTQENIIYNVYIKLLQQCGADINHLETFKHNLIMTAEFMMIVVRKQGSYNGISLNAVGFTGSILAKNEEECEKLKQMRIGDVLENLAEFDDNTYENLLEC